MANRIGSRRRTAVCEFKILNYTMTHFPNTWQLKYNMCQRPQICHIEKCPPVIVTDMYIIFLPPVLLYILDLPTENALDVGHKE